MLQSVRLPRITAWRIALLYAALALPFVLVLAIEVPPLMPPDETAHFERADQISRLELLAFRFPPDHAGGTVDSGLVEAFFRFSPVLFDETAKVTRASYAPIAWGFTGVLAFPNTALYPPVFYLPAAVLIDAGKWIGLDLVRTLLLARCGLGLVSVGIATIAIGLSGPASIWLFSLLLLPSSAMLMGAVSQDGPMLACAALAAALVIRLRRPDQAGWRAALIVLGLITAVLGMARPPYAALVLLPLATRTPPARLRWIAAGSSLLLVAIWWGWCLATTWAPVDPYHKADGGAQVRYLLTHLTSLPALVANTMAAHFTVEYAHWFIAPLQLPEIFFDAAGIALALAVVAAVLAGARPQSRTVAVLGGATIASICGIFLIQYLTWTPVGYATVEGVLGRYFIPLAAVLGGCLAPGDAGAVRPRWLLHPPLLLFPVFGIVLAVHAIVLRYYL